MLSLVAYDNSDSEENDSSNENENSENVEIMQVVTKANGQTDNANVANNTDIFTSLPQPRLNQGENILEEEEDEFLKKKEVPAEKPKKPTVKINIPSLAEFDSDEDDAVQVKKPKIDEKQCGLFALLPPPKAAPITTKHFVPNSVKKNMNRNVKPKITPIVKDKKEKTSDVQDSDDDDMTNLPETYDDDIWQKVCGKKEKRVPKPKLTQPLETNYIVQPNPEVEKPYDGLDNKAFKELISANSKRKGDSIDIIDINEDEMLADKNIWMTKSLTDPEMAPKHVIDDPVNDTCKRKHHITYLAQQAKANEQELQNQWASSRFTRQKTQAKYGF